MHTYPLFPDRWPNRLFYLLLTTGLLCVLGPVSFSLGKIVPVSLQSMLVVLAPFLIGKRNGTIAVGLYLLAGFAGLPVFAGGSSGLAKLWGPTGGFLLSFPLAAFVTGLLAEKGGALSPVKVLGAMLMGQLLILLTGFTWLVIYQGHMAELGGTLLSFLPGLMLKTILGTGVYFAGKWMSRPRGS